MMRTSALVFNAGVGPRDRVCGTRLTSRKRFAACITNRGVWALIIIEFTQKDGRKERTAKRAVTLVCDKRDKDITCVLCRDLHLKAFLVIY